MVSEDVVVDDDAPVDTVAGPDPEVPTCPVVARPALLEQAPAATAAASSTAPSLICGPMTYLRLF